MFFSTRRESLNKDDTANELLLLFRSIGIPHVDRTPSFPLLPDTSKCTM